MKICTSSNTNILEEMVKGIFVLFNSYEKVNYHQRNIETKDLVLLKEDKVSQSHYTLARVLKTYPEKDGVVRTVRVKTPSNTLVSPAGKIYLMEKYTAKKFTS